MSEELLDEIAAGARRVLDENWLGASTLPSRTLYPHQWSWDSAFIAIGRSWYDEPRAQQELRSLFRGQWADGRVPHIVFNPTVGEEAYFPGPAFWRSSQGNQVLLCSGGPELIPQRRRAPRQKQQERADLPVRG